MQALQKPKLRICEQAPAFNIRLLHLRCATAAPLGLIAALHLPHFDNKIGAKCEHSAVGKLPERWLIFDDPSLLRLGNISRSASTPKAENENL